MNTKEKNCFNGEIITKNDYSYNKDRQIWNRAIQKFPKLIIYCDSSKDIICAVKYAVKIA